MVIDQYGKRPLRMAEMPYPIMDSHDVIVEIYAASINPIDFKLRDGGLKMLLHYKMPLIMGNDFAGIIVEVGSKASKFKVGDEVYGRPRKSRIGTFAEYISIHEDDIALKPTNLTFEEAASIPLVGLTSYQALNDIMKLKKGQKVLIQAGAGGVGTFAIQLAKNIGAYVATTTRGTGRELVESLGADYVINVLEEKFEEAISEYDAIFDTIGGIVLERSYAVVKRGGILYQFRANLTNVLQMSMVLVA